MVFLYLLSHYPLNIIVMQLLCGLYYAIFPVEVKGYMEFFMECSGLLTLTGSLWFLVFAQAGGTAAV